MKKPRSYFKSLKTYTGSQLNFIDSVIYKDDITDIATVSVAGHGKVVSNADAITRTDATGGWISFLQPHQQSMNIETATGSHALLTTVSKDGLSLKTYGYDSLKRHDYKWVVLAGGPETAGNINCIGVADTGIYLKAVSTVFEVSTGSLSLVTGGIPMAKLAVLTADRGVVSGTGGVLEATTTTKDGINSIASIGNDKVVVSGATGLLAGSAVITLAQLAFLNVVAGTATADKAVVLSAASKIDVMDITTLKVNGTTVTSTAAELNYNAGVTAGTRTINKTIVVDGSGKIDALDITTLTLNGTAVTATPAEINKLAGFTGVVADLNAISGIDASGVTAADLQAIDGFDGIISVTGDVVSIASGKYLQVNGVIREPVNLKTTAETIAATEKKMYVDLSGADVTLQLRNISATNIGESHEILILNNTMYDLILDPIDGTENVSFNGSEAATATIKSPPPGSVINIYVLDADTWAICYSRPVRAQTGVVDVAAVATKGEAGDVYVKTDTGNVYVKKDSGSSTNWYILN